MDPNEQLIAAVAAGNVATTRAALRAGASPDTSYGCEQLWDRERVTGEESVLQRAARDGHAAIVGELLSHGADPNVRDSVGGRSPLFEAAARGDLEIVTMLLAAGAAIATDPPAVDGGALAASIQGGHAQVAEALVAAGAIATPHALELASHRGDDRLADLCLRSGATRDPQALVAAARAGNVGVILRLVDGGADLAAVSGEALCEAANAGKHEAAALLLSLGASPGFRNSYGWPPLHFAAYQADAALCEILLRAGADPQATDDQGRTAIDWANEAGKAANVATIARAARGA